MNKRKLAKIKARLMELLGTCSSGLATRELTALAKKLGRKRKPGRTTEPTYVRKVDPQLSPPLSIPGHKQIKGGTARSVIRALLEDADVWDQYLMFDEGDDQDQDDDEDEDEDSDNDNDAD